MRLNVPLFPNEAQSWREQLNIAPSSAGVHHINEVLHQIGSIPKGANLNIVIRAIRRVPRDKHSNLFPNRHQFSPKQSEYWVTQRYKERNPACRRGSLSHRRVPTPQVILLALLSRYDNNPNWKFFIPVW